MIERRHMVTVPTMPHMLQAGAPTRQHNPIGHGQKCGFDQDQVARAFQQAKQQKGTVDAAFGYLEVRVT